MLVFVSLRIIALIVLLAGASAVDAAETGPQLPVALFLPRQFFADDEYEALSTALARQGFTVTVTSIDTAAAISTGRVIIRPDRSLAALPADSFAALILVGGPGMVLHWDDSLLHARCREFAAAGRPVAALGIAPIALARAGVLVGRRAAVFQDRNARQMLTKAGARFSFRQLVVDGPFITATDARQGQRLIGALVRAIRNR